MYTVFTASTAEKNVHSQPPLPLPPPPPWSPGNQEGPPNLSHWVQADSQQVCTSGPTVAGSDTRPGHIPRSHSEETSHTLLQAHSRCVHALQYAFPVHEGQRLGTDETLLWKLTSSASLHLPFSPLQRYGMGTWSCSATLWIATGSSSKRRELTPSSFVCDTTSSRLASE